MNAAYFFDANAIYKYYQGLYQYSQPEKGTDIVQNLVQTNPYHCFISAWGVVEFVSIFRIKIAQAGKATEQNQLRQTFFEVYRRFMTDLSDEIFTVEALPESWRQRATQLIIDYGVNQGQALKTPDAIQIVAFEAMCQRMPATYMVTSDQKVIEICQDLGLAVLDPSLGKS